MYKLGLPRLLSSCPMYWQNFVDANYNEFGTHNHLDESLLEYNAKFVEYNPIDKISVEGVEFETEKDFLIFKLKWS